MKKIIVFILIIFSVACDDSTSPLTEIPKPGFCLTFDDTSVNEWNNIMDLLDSNKVKASFFITLVYKLSKEELELLRKFQNDGHEIGCHGLNHIDAINYLTNHTIQEYLDIEIIPSMNILKDNGLNISTFAYPYGKNCDSLDTEMLKTFTALRDVAEEQRKPLEKNVEDIDEIFYKFDGKQLITGLGIDINFKITLEMIEACFQRAVKNNEVIVFYCHKPIEKSNASYQIEYNYLRGIFNLAKKYNLTNYTLSELVNL